MLPTASIQQPPIGRVTFLTYDSLDFHFAWHTMNLSPTWKLFVPSAGIPALCLEAARQLEVTETKLSMSIEGWKNSCWNCLNVQVNKCHAFFGKLFIKTGESVLIAATRIVAPALRFPVNLAAEMWLRSRWLFQTHYGKIRTSQNNLFPNTSFNLYSSGDLGQYGGNTTSRFCPVSITND